MATKAEEKAIAAIPVGSAQVFTHINSLLYTLRSIAQREDQLCMLMHHLRTSGKISASLQAELHEILEEIPEQEYLHDLRTLRASVAQLEEESGGPRSRTGSRRRAA